MPPDLVVSEETGAISVAQNGELTRNVTESQVRSRLGGAAVGHVALMERWLKRPAEWADEEIEHK